MHFKTINRIFLFCLLVLMIGGSLVTNAPVQAADSGNAQVGSTSQPQVNPESTVNGLQIGFAQEYGKTTIWLRICADAPNFQMRSENVGKWSTEVFLRTRAVGGCSPSTVQWWRMIYNADPNTGEVFRIYATANDSVLSEAAFMQRAARTDCRVTGYGTGYCTPASPAPVSAPTVDINEPAAGQNVQGTVTVRGWAADTGSISGTGVTDVHVRVNGTLIGAATYGESRPDVGSYLGDARFTNSGYRITFNTNQFAPGAATLQIAYRSAITGGWHTLERQIAINNLPPNPPSLVSPVNGAILSLQNVTLQVQDTGDPDNGPRNYRDFFFAIERTDGSWSQTSGWRGNNWTVAVPSRGIYRWRAQSGDGASASTWTGWSTFTSSIVVPVPPPVTPPPGPGVWNVPYYWQGDPQWGGTRIGACNNTIRNVGCALTSLSMIFQYYGANKNPGTLNSCMGGHSCPLYWGSATINTCSNGKVKWGSWPGFSYARLEQELKKGPVILEIKNSGGGLHFIVVLGGSGSDPRNYTVNDPGVKNGARTKLSSTLAIFKGYTPSSMRIYTGTPAAAISQASALPALVSPKLSGDEVITGTMELYRNTDTEMVLELAAQSSAGPVTEMQIWTDQQLNDVWQPFAAYVSAPLDNSFNVKFRDGAGNTSAVISVAVPTAPEGIQTAVRQIYLPLVMR